MSILQDVRLPRTAVALTITGAVLAALLLLLLGRIFVDSSALATGGADVVKNPGAANLFVGDGPLQIEEVFANVPENPGLGAFDLRIRYDPELVQITAKEGPFLGSTGRSTSCFSSYLLPGELQFSCSSSGVEDGPGGTGVAAYLNVTPSTKVMPRATQNNGIKMLVDDVLAYTRLVDTKGGLIGVRMAGDTKLFVRALEGDVNYDCVVDKDDSAIIKSRVGARKGTLYYNQKYDLQPSYRPDGDIDVNDLQIVNGRIGSTCDNPHPAQPSPTPQPTWTPVVKVTATPMEGPPLRKSPVLQNLWLTRQGEKIPPVACAGTGGTTDHVEIIQELIEPLDTEDQELGGFSFEVNYDSKRVCVEIQPGPAANDMICLIEDAVTAPALQNSASILCTTQGKDTTGPTTKEPKGRHIATVIVRPQPDVYSKFVATNNNGIVVLIQNKKCTLSDLQGMPIAPSSCEDAAITIRYLEGDVDPNCMVDNSDAQLVAFRLGAEKGSLLYNARFDLQPPGGDGDIDVNDLQFVYGRFGSTCDDPHPPQDPVNPLE